MIDQQALMRVLSEFADGLVRHYEVSDALHDLVDGVSEVLGIVGAGVSLAENDRITFATAAPESVTILERVQERTQDGPCVVAHRTAAAVLVPDLAEIPDRWPALTEAVAAVGIVSVAGIPMHLNGSHLGALNLYDDVRHDWTEEEVRVAQLLADMATAYIANAARLELAEHTAAQLQVALDSRVIIEQAKGILAGEQQISVDEAFARLRRHARSNQASLRSVAEAVVNFGLRPAD